MNAIFHCKATQAVGKALQKCSIIVIIVIFIVIYLFMSRLPIGSHGSALVPSSTGLHYNSWPDSF